MAISATPCRHYSLFFDAIHAAFKIALIAAAAIFIIYAAADCRRCRHAAAGCFAISRRLPFSPLFDFRHYCRHFAIDLMPLAPCHAADIDAMLHVYAAADYYLRHIIITPLTP